jgi:cobalt-precorrin-5B (C1)-methyltransferase
MANENYTVKNGKRMRFGYTTGSCAAAAAEAACELLLAGVRIQAAEILLPGGTKAVLEILDHELNDGKASCSVVKDGGDDPDITTGLKIFATVSRSEAGVNIDGGEGVGRVTARGLQRGPGEPAINPVPVKMIEDSVTAAKNKYGYDGGIDVVISVPGGEKAARKTYNPRLGIVGGISILGTTGIVEPMSEKALIDTIKVEMDRKYADDPEKILIAPGNYGQKYCLEQLGLDIEKSVQTSNYIGESLDYIVYKGFRNILFVGHTGKLVKLAAGVMNTHSYVADCRMETIAAHCGCCGARPETMEKILKCITTDDAFDLIQSEPYYEEVKARIMERAMYHLNYRLKGAARIEVVMFTTGRNHVIMSDGAREMIEKFREEN